MPVHTHIPFNIALGLVYTLKCWLVIRAVTEKQTNE